ncbi:MAG: TolC family outer membrane protein [Gammaproteobacteria bacterium]|nr:TolC family outer membrane protein [Gammaproteobacteria bacterium]
MTKTLLSLSILLGLSVQAQADSLLDIYNLAKQNDPQILAAAAGRDAGQEAVPQARSALLPQASLTASREYNDGERSFVNFNDSGIRTITTTSDGETDLLNLRITQQIYHHDTWIGLSQAEKQAERANLDYQAAQQGLIVRVAQAYFDVLAAEDNVDYAKSNKEAIGRQLEQTKQRFNVGLIAITDVHEAQARFDQANSDEILAQNQLDTAHESLREITARYHDQLAKLSGDIALNSPAPASVDDWIKFSESQNPALSAQQLATDVAREEVKRRSAGHLPSVDLIANHTDSDTDSDSKIGSASRFPSDSSFEDTSLTVQVSVPLFSGGRTSSTVREGESLFQQSQQQLEQRHRAVVKDTKNAYLGVNASIAGVKALQQAVVSSQSALEATQAGFEVGTRTIVDVLDSTRALYLAQRNLAQAKYNYLLNGLRLKQAGGILKEDDLAAVNSLLR